MRQFNAPKTTPGQLGPALSRLFRASLVGSGAGLPGVPLAIAHSGLSVTLLEATEKKAAFLEHLVGNLKLGGVGVLTGRAETLAHDVELRERFDFVASRAVAKLSVLVELTLPFCRVAGL